jgi:hypothetical protein
VIVARCPPLGPDRHEQVANARGIEHIVPDGRFARVFREVLRHQHDRLRAARAGESNLGPQRPPGHQRALADRGRAPVAQDAPCKLDQPQRRPLPGVPAQVAVEVRPVEVEIAVEQPGHERDHHGDRAPKARQLMPQAQQYLIGCVRIDGGVRRLDAGDRLDLRGNGVGPVEAVAEDDRFAGEDDRRPVEIRPHAGMVRAVAERPGGVVNRAAAQHHKPGMVRLEAPAVFRVLDPLRFLVPAFLHRAPGVRVENAFGCGDGSGDGEHGGDEADYGLPAASAFRRPHEPRAEEKQYPHAHRRDDQAENQQDALLHRPRPGPGRQEVIPLPAGVHGQRGGEEQSPEQNRGRIGHRNIPVAALAGHCAVPLPEIRS